MNVANSLELLPDRPSQETLKKLRGAVEKWRADGSGALPRAMALEDLPNPNDPRIFARGNPNRPGRTVPRRFLKVLAGDNPPPFKDGSGRLDLANAIVDPKNPLTARVIVNRVWMYHFGAPIVGTPSDFGSRGEPPTHPELLDWLAASFVEDGWSIKSLHRRIMLSDTYQQASDERADGLRIDPENRLYWRTNRRRLDIEAMRDALLCVAGCLDDTVGGRSVDNVFAPSVHRRTLYGSLDRLNLPGIYRTFDFPDPNATSSRREATVVPTQALFLMNNPLVRDLAQATARRPEILAAANPEERGRSSLRASLRTRADRRRVASRGGFSSSSEAEREAAWSQYTRALLMSNAFVFID